MRQVKNVPLLILAIITFSYPCLGQTDSEIQRLGDDLRQLTDRVTDQEKRIANLEQYLGAKDSSKKPPVSQGAQPFHGRTQSDQKPPSWHNSVNWSKVTMGMTQQQVIAILGRPTSVGGSGDNVDYIYEGEVAGSGYVKGSVEFVGNRVGARLFEPVFLNK